MKRSLQLTLATVLVSTALMMASCSGGKTEDVRIKLCKKVTQRLLNEFKPVVFKSSATQFRKQGDAAVTLSFTINRQGGENKIVNSTCFYEYEIPEESAVDHVDPLFAYSTLPYAMSINNNTLPKEILTKAVSAEQLEPIIEFIEEIKRDL